MNTLIHLQGTEAGAVMLAVVIPAAIATVWKDARATLRRMGRSWVTGESIMKGGEG